MQRLFTVRLSDLKHMNYAKRLTHLKLEKLVVRPLSKDLLETFKIVNNMSVLNFYDFFTLSHMNSKRVRR